MTKQELEKLHANKAVLQVAEVKHPQQAGVSVPRYILSLSLSIDEINELQFLLEEPKNVVVQNLREYIDRAWRNAGFDLSE